jgi:DNA polymerase alpha subunit B
LNSSERFLNLRYERTDAATMASVMERDLKKALLMRSTMYKDLAPALLESLAALAGASGGPGAKGLAAAFDKFMTVSRAESAAVAPEDVSAFAAEAARLAAAKARGNLFNRGSWEDVDVDSPAGAAAAAKAAAGAAPGSHPSQRLTPYLAKAAAAAAKRPRTPASAPSSAKFRERAARGAVVATLNEHLPAPEARAADAPRAEVAVLGAPLARGARYMVNRLEDRAAYLEARIAALEDAVEASGAEGGAQPLGSAAQQPAVFVGRVVADVEGGRLNAQSAMLEGSARLSGGVRVRLDLAHCPTFRLFPGQVVAVRGTNPTGFCVVATGIAAGAPPPPARSPLAALAAAAGGPGGGAAAIFVAAGPYTSSEDLAYEPLAALLAEAAARRPDVLLLLGPFVDAEHAAVLDPALDETFEEVFESRVAARLEAFASGAGRGVRVVIVPSPRDAHADPVFPQPPLAPLAGGAALCAANPATLRAGGLVLGASSADWLMAASREEAARAAPGAERLPALAQHLVAQGSFFPMFPPPAGLPLDASKAAALAMPVAPDVLLVPSDLAPFAKFLPVPAGGAAGAAGVAINPGRLARGAAGGTYARLFVGPHGEAAAVAAGAPAATNGDVAHCAAARTRVEIVRI